MDISPRDFCCELHEVDVPCDSTCDEPESDFIRGNDSTKRPSVAEIGLEGSDHLEEGFFREFEMQHVGIEDLRRSDSVPPAFSQRTEFFELSPPR